LKELEKLAPKEKGITAQSVKEVLTALEADQEVRQEKIGISNFFWYFPSDDVVKKEKQLTKFSGQVESLKRKRIELQSEMKSAQQGREETSERKSKLAKLSDLNQQSQNLKKTMAELAENDPALIDALKSDANNAKQAANRWTDNILALKSYAMRNFGMSEEDFCQMFEFPSNFDYL
jgi:chromosome segregation ATPase